MAIFESEIVALSDLKPHPKNYQEHPEDQIDHLIESIKTNGVYRNIVIAQDNTILAGHGVTKALAKMGIENVPVVRLPISPDSSQALKVLAGDNEVKNLAEVNLFSLAEILGEIQESDNLIGTGYDEMKLANLLVITNNKVAKKSIATSIPVPVEAPMQEPEKLDEFDEWNAAGMDTYNPYTVHSRIEVSFLSEDDRELFAKKLGLELSETIKSIWYPTRDGD